MLDWCIVISMKKKYLAKFNVKDKAARAELLRAHSMIILLVIAFMTTLTLSTTLEIALDPILSFGAVILLACVALLSLSVVVSLVLKKK